MLDAKIKRAAYAAALDEMNRHRPAGRKLKALFGSDEKPADPNSSSDQGLSAEGLEKVLDFLSGRLSAADLDSVNAIIADTTGDDDDMLASDRAMAADKRGSAESGFLSRYPGASNIKLADAQHAPAPRERSMSEADSRNFYARYPDAAKIGRA